MEGMLNVSLYFFNGSREFLMARYTVCAKSIIRSQNTSVCTDESQQTRGWNPIKSPEAPHNECECGLPSCWILTFHSITTLFLLQHLTSAAW